MESSWQPQQLYVCTLATIINDTQTNKQTDKQQKAQSRLISSTNRNSAQINVTHNGNIVTVVIIVVVVVDVASPLAINTNLQHFRMFTRDFS